MTFRNWKGLGILREASRNLIREMLRIKPKSTNISLFPATFPPRWRPLTVQVHAGLSKFFGMLCRSDSEGLRILSGRGQSGGRHPLSRSYQLHCSLFSWRYY